jgi:hypothetical protein
LWRIWLASIGDIEIPATAKLISQPPRPFVQSHVIIIGATGSSTNQVATIRKASPLLFLVSLTFNLKYWLGG